MRPKFNVIVEPTDSTIRSTVGRFIQLSLAEDLANRSSLNDFHARYVVEDAATTATLVTYTRGARKLGWHHPEMRARVRKATANRERNLAMLAAQTYKEPK